MVIYLLDNSLRVEVSYQQPDREFTDNIMITIIEDCPADEKVFRMDETNLYLTPQQACQLATALREAATRSRADACHED